MQYSASRRSEQKGSIFLLITVVLAVSFMVAGLVIDNGREELTVQNVQRAADAAALAGASRLDGTIDGWRRAKIFAVATLRQNRIHGVSPGAIAGLSLTSGSPSYWDVNAVGPNAGQTMIPAAMAGTSGTAENVTVTVERGAFWYDSDDFGNGSYSFESWEDAIARKPKKGNGPEKTNTDSYLVANAVRVRVRVDSWQSFLGGLFGVGSFSNLERVAIAVSDGDVLSPMLPIGIQVGFLLHDNDPTTTNAYRATEDPRTVAADRYIATFAGARNERDNGSNPDNVNLPITAEQFEMGFQRYENSVSSTLYNDIPANTPTVCLPQPFPFDTVMNNCKAIEVRSTVLGVPSGRPRQTATAGQVTNAIVSGVRAGVGQWFAPLQGAEAAELFTNDAHMNIIAQKMNDAANPQFSDFFDRFKDSGSTSLNQLFPRLPNRIVPSDPFGRLPDDPVYELIKPFPRNQAGDESITAKFVRGDSTGTSPNDALYRFHNPLCFDPRMNGGLANDRQMRVIEGYAAIVDADAPGIDYTDFRYDNGGQNAKEVLKQTKPRMIGKKRIVIWGGNFRNLDAAFPPGPPPNAAVPASWVRASPTIVSKNDGAPNTIVGENTFAFLDTNELGFSEWKRKKREYKDDLDQWESCVEGTAGDGSPDCDIPDSNDLLYHPPLAIRACFNLEGIIGDVQQLVGDIVSNYGLDGENCDDEPEDCNWRASTNGEQIAGQIETAIETFIANLSNAPLVAWPNTHCAYFLDDRSRPNQANSYREDMDPFYAGMGCAGLEYSVIYNAEPTSFATGKTFGQQQPTLVKEL